MNPLEASYRYTLTRDLRPLVAARTEVPGFVGTGRVVFVMLNPSTADETVDDPTIRRVMRFGAAHGFAELIVVNLFAVRATDPALLLSFDSPIGADNAVVIEDAFAASDAIVFAWGAWHSANNARRHGIAIPRLNVEGIAKRSGKAPMCLGKTKDGSPRHPLYVAASTRLEAY